jgi:hypothetical protein
MECSCAIDACCDGDTYEESEEKILTHNSPSVIIECGECGETIALNEEFEWYRGEYDGVRHVHHTCMDCLSLRHYFFENWTFKNIWADFEENMDECYWEVPESCLSKTTPLTRSKICTWIEQYWEDEG